MTGQSTEAAISYTLRCARYFRRLGLCPIPSRMDKKAPILKLRPLYDGWPVPEYVYTESYWRTTNMQLLTGTTTPAETRIVVVDIDGNEAYYQWVSICLDLSLRVHPATWIAETDRGVHIWFSLPEGVSECKSGILWGIWDTLLNKGRGDWKSNAEIRMIADRSLIFSPPSFHVKSGKQYGFLLGHTPKDFKLPMEAPLGLLGMPRLKPPVFHQDVPRPLYQPKQKELPDHQYSRADVLDAVSNQDGVASVARNWGVVFTGPLSWRKDWIPCFVPGREDPKRSNPSGSFNCDSGSVYDFATGQTMSFFDVGVATGQFATWQDCCNHLGEIYIGAKK